MSFHAYTIKADERPGWETTAPNMRDAIAECRFVVRKGHKPRVTYRKTPDHVPVSVPVLTSPSGSVEFGNF